MSSIVTIGIVSISSLLPREQLDAGTNALASAGYRIKVAPNVARAEVASPEERARLLEAFWLDPEIDLLLFARGGEGAADVVPLLDWERLRARPDLPVMGFSDVTLLLNAMLAKGVGHPVSGPMLSYATRLTPEARDWAHRVLRGEALPAVRCRAVGGEGGVADLGGGPGERPGGGARGAGGFVDVHADEG